MSASRKCALVSEGRRGTGRGGRVGWERGLSQWKEDDGE